MSDMKCPFCQQELLLSSFRDGDKDNETWNCLHCQIGGKRKLWQELIRTRKALDVAVDALRHADWFFDGDYNVYTKDMHNEIKCAIKAITALEQKDK